MTVHALHEIRARDVQSVRIILLQRVGIPRSPHDREGARLAEISYGAAGPADQSMNREVPQLIRHTRGSSSTF